MLPMVYKKAPFSLFMGWGAFYTEGVISAQKYALGGLAYHEHGDFSEKYHVRGIAAPKKYTFVAGHWQWPRICPNLRKWSRFRPCRPRRRHSALSPIGK